jgi:hypothetical protein
MKGIIYKIVCNETGECYYGSTQQSLNERMTCHKSGCKAWKLGNTGHSTSYDIIDRGNYSYVLIETVECENKHQLHERERCYIENNECINHVIPTRTIEEYNNDNREAQKERCRMYKQTHQEEMKKYREQRKDKTNEWREANKDKIKEQTKLYRELHKEHLNELRRQRRAKQRELGLPVY